MLSLLLAVVLPSPTFAAYVPPVQRYPSVRQSGHNAENDESARGCNLDLVHFKENGETKWLMFYLWSDARSRLGFTLTIPASGFPLKEGAEWEDGIGRRFRYVNGTLENVDGSYRLKIDSLLMKPDFAEAHSLERPETRLSCEF